LLQQIITQNGLGWRGPQTSSSSDALHLVKIVNGFFFLFKEHKNSEKVKNKNKITTKRVKGTM